MYTTLSFEHIIAFKCWYVRLFKSSLSNFIAIIIKKADKSSSVVIMNRSDYIKEVERQLKNDKYYEHLNEDPSENLAKDIKILLKILHEKNGKLR